MQSLIRESQKIPSRMYANLSLVFRDDYVSSRRESYLNETCEKMMEDLGSPLKRAEEKQPHTTLLKAQRSVSYRTLAVEQQRSITASYFRRQVGTESRQASPFRLSSYNRPGASDISRDVSPLKFPQQTPPSDTINKREAKAAEKQKALECSRDLEES